MPAEGWSPSRAAPPGRVGAPSSGAHGATDCAGSRVVQAVPRFVVHGGPWHSGSGVAGIEAGARRGAWRLRTTWPAPLRRTAPFPCGAGEPCQSPGDGPDWSAHPYRRRSARRRPVPGQPMPGAEPGERAAPECPAAPFSGPLRPLEGLARPDGPWPPLAPLERVPPPAPAPWPWPGEPPGGAGSPTPRAAAPGGGRPESCPGGGADLAAPGGCPGPMRARVPMARSGDHSSGG